MRTRLLALAATALLVLVGACADDDDDAADATTTTTAPAGTDGDGTDGDGTDEPGPDTGDTVVEATGAFAFSPATVEIDAGDSVTWRNTGGAPHTVTSTSGPMEFGESLNAGDEVTITFDEPGTYEYECTFHAGMTGTVVVS